MDSEAPTSSTDPCKINGAKKARRHLGARRQSPSSERPASLEQISVNNEEVEFVDEEALYNMPLLVDSMAQGMLITPPALKKGFNWTDDNPHHNDNVFTLWTD
ncbi:DNA-binding domain protein [Salvia divinorum]|uniref:DNA-binding domain protein n=1 Tax=Salvia divinorum TaxID=28513 RepID=A0ABD1HP26_SALDI